jgi:magnesium transporter
VIVNCAHYKDGTRQHGGKIDLDQAAACLEEDGFVWVGLHEPSSEEMEEVARRFNLHELAVEDTEFAHQRPKIEDYDGSYFIVLRTARYHDESETVHFGEIHLFVAPKYVITVRHGEGSELGPAREALEARPDLLRLGPASAVWAVVDKVVDDYAPVVAGIEDDIEEVETDVFDDSTAAPTQRIYFLKREVVEFHRATWPLLEPLEGLERGAYGGIDPKLAPFFRDVADHARRVDEQVNSQRELLTSILEANLALVSVSQNEVVKQISAVAAIIAVPTFIASVYGMNFDHMPELHWVFGYPLALTVMVLSSALLFRFFRRIDWL